MSNLAITTSLSLMLLSGPLLALAVRGFAPLLALAGLAGLIAMLASFLEHRRRFQPAALRHHALPLLAFGYILLSALWGVSDRAADTAFRLLATSGFGAAIIWGFAQLPDDKKQIWTMRRLVSMAGGIALALLIGPYNVYWPDLPELLEDHFELLRQVNSALSLLPIFLFLLGLAWHAKSTKLIYGALGVALLVTAVSESQTSLLSMLLGLTAFALAKISRHLGRRLVFAALTICTLCAPPIFIAAYENNWIEKYAPNIVTERGAGEIRQWLYFVYAKEAVSRPLFGHGLNGTKYFAPQNLESYAKPVLNKPKVSTFATAALESGVVAAHAHNIFLQLIFEFGYLGALLILATIWQGFKRLDAALDDAAGVWMWGAIGAALGTLMFGFTLWHSWLMAAIAASVVLAYCAHCAYRNT